MQEQAVPNSSTFPLTKNHVFAVVRISFHHPSSSEWWQRIACLCNVRANLTLDGNEYAKYGTARSKRRMWLRAMIQKTAQEWGEERLDGVEALQTYTPLQYLNRKG